MTGPPNTRSKHRILCFNDADANAFGEALRERYPAIRFRMFHYHELQIRPAPGEAPRCEVPLYGSLGTAPEKFVRVAIEPDGWTPVWEGPNPNGIMVVANSPRLHFVYEASRRYPRPDGNSLDQGAIWAYYDVDDREHLRFLNAVWRISAKLSTNILDMVDRYTGKVTYPSQRTIVWTGFHALDWCRKDPARRINGMARPAADPARAAQHGA